MLEFHARPIRLVAQYNVFGSQTWHIGLAGYSQAHRSGPVNRGHLTITVASDSLLLLLSTVIIFATPFPATSIATMLYFTVPSFNMTL